MKNKKFWNWVKNDVTDTPTTRTLYLNGVISSEGWFDDDVTPKMFKDELESGSGDIEVWLDSPGGDVYAATQIYNMLKSYNGKVTVKIDSLAASAASVIAMAGDEVLMSPLSLLMLHNPITIAAGNTDDMQKAIDMLDEVKERKSNNVISSKTKTASKTGISNSISDLTQIVNDIELKRKKFSENQSERIKRIEDHIDSQKNDISKREYNISKCEEKLRELDMEIRSSADDLISERRETTSELAKRTARIDEVSKILINRDKPVCPICGSDLCSDHAKGYFDDLEKEKISLIEEREILENTDRQIEISINRAREKEAFKEKLRTRIEQEKRSIETLKSGIDYDEKQIESIKSETNDFDSSSTRAKLDEYKKQLEIVTAELDDLSEKIAVDMDLITILSDGGIKRYFFEEIIPILNQKVNEYVEKFGLNLVISFNNMLEYTISKGSFELEYNGLSNGEKTRVNVAMLLTFYDIAKQLSNWSSSILFMDEIFDSGVDSDGISDFLRELISMLNRDEKLGVYLISHKLNDVNFSQIQYKFETLRVQKKGAFSQIVKG